MFDEMNLKSKISSWLEEEDINISEVVNPQSEFQLILENAFGLGLVIDIAKPKNKSFLINAMKIKYPSQMKESFSLLSPIQKFKFLEMIKRNLLELNVDFTISSEMDHLDIVNYVYLEDLTRTVFMNSLKSIRNAGTITISLLTEEFSLIRTPTPHHTHSNMISPYG